MFQEYQTKVVTKQATRIKTMPIKADHSNCYLYSENGIMVYFNAYLPPIVGDWIVKESEEDVYHVTDRLFRDKYIVAEEEE